MSRPFTFALEKILEHRRRLEDEAKAELAEVRSRYQRAVERRDALAAEIAGVDLTAPATADEMWLKLRYKERLLLDLDATEKLLTRLAAEVAQARERLVVRAKDRKALEKLKERQHREHLEHERERERKQFDDMATVRHGREPF